MNPLILKLSTRLRSYLQLICLDEPSRLLMWTSSPGNEVDGEDDRDSEEIIILENLCAATFDIDAGNEPVCAGKPMILMADVNSGAFPMNYTWRFNGEIVSRDSVYILEDHNGSHYGTYSLTVRDANNCTGTEFITIEPIINEDRFSCINDIYIGVNSTCSARLLPEQITTRNVNAINDYILEIRDNQGNLVDLSDLSAYGAGTILEARVINPCTGEVLCWSNLHLEHKTKPEFEFYTSQHFDLPCPKIEDTSPSEIIETFNEKHPDAILSAGDFASALNQEVCLQTWDVEAVDELNNSGDACSPYEVRRIYFVYDQELRWPIDTAHLWISPIRPDSILIPGDLDNLMCGVDISPDALQSFPAYYHGDSLQTLDNSYNNHGAVFCNVSISYTDQDYRDICQFGTSKVVRRWSVLDWCSTTVKEGIQHIFVNDKEAPSITVPSDVISITTLPFACSAMVPIFDYLNVHDFCDDDVRIFINGSESGSGLVEIPLGEHSVLIEAVDRCGNKASRSIDFSVKELTPPTAILHRDLSISLSQDPAKVVTILMLLP